MSLDLVLLVFLIMSPFIVPFSLFLLYEAIKRKHEEKKFYNELSLHNVINLKQYALSKGRK